MGVVQVPEGDVARAAGYVEDVLGWGVGRVGGEAGVEGGDVVISVTRLLLATSIWQGNGDSLSDSG